jgi:hypothetical protein
VEIGSSILLIAVGASLTWAVSASVSGIDLQVTGIILMIVGPSGLVTSLVFWSSWVGFGSRAAAVGSQNMTNPLRLERAPSPTDRLKRVAGAKTAAGPRDVVTSTRCITF